MQVASMLVIVALAGMPAAPAPPPSTPVQFEVETKLRPLDAVPWETAATTTIDAEERTFQADGATLSGTLYTPRDGRNLAAVVVFHGAQLPLRDTPLYRHLPRMLAPLGIAVFVFDRRGSGRSGGELKDSDYAMLADDGIAAQRMLAADPRVDPARIGFWGLSQGGWIALLAAQRSPEAAFAISVSAPLTKSEPQMLFAIANSLKIKGYPQAEVDMAVRTRDIIGAYYRGETDRAAAQEALDAALPRPWFNLTYLPRALTDPKTSRWPREMANDPLATIGKVKIPTLLLFGARDPWIPVQASVDQLKALEIRRNMEWAVIADADHTMSVSAPPWQQIDPAYMSDDVPEAPAYFSQMAGWLTRLEMTQPRHR